MNISEHAAITDLAENEQQKQKHNTDDLHLQINISLIDLGLQKNLHNCNKQQTY